MLLLPLLCGGIMMHIRELAHVLPGVKLIFLGFFIMEGRGNMRGMFVVIITSAVRRNNDRFNGCSQLTLFLGGCQLKVHPRAIMPKEVHSDTKVTTESRQTTTSSVSTSPTPHTCVCVIGQQNLIKKPIMKETKTLPKQGESQRQ